MSSIDANKPTTYEIEREDWGLEEVTITSETELTNIKLTIEKHIKEPKNKLTTAYEYYTIKTSEDTLNKIHWSTPA